MWDDGRVRFSYPSNWRVDVVRLPSRQIRQVVLADAADQGVLSIRTAEPGLISSPRTEVEEIAFDVATATSAQAGMSAAVDGPTLPAESRTVFGAGAQGATTALRLSAGGVALPPWNVTAWSVVEGPEQRSATVWVVWDDATEHLDAPGVALVLDTLSWSEPVNAHP
ncbi:MAG: hypothetical protein KC656_07930 [Myxococcales bacterium]|nr:hypothetical protein [Myxococcales bacterium]MCA9567756.1 hypothetical protein [Myxococcales bacterium]